MFYDFCRVDFQLADSTAKEYRRKMRRFFQAVDKPVSGITTKDVRDYLSLFRDGNKNSYANALKPLKAFFCSFMKADKVVESFKFPKRPQEPIVVPTRKN